jgi:hypothetical protein
MKIASILALGLLACGGVDNGDLFDDSPDAGPEFGTVEQGWATRKSASGGRTWGATEGAGQACILNQTTDTECFFHGHNGSDTLDVVVKYWVNPQWTNAYDDTVRFLVDGFVTYATSVTNNGQAFLPWSFQRLSGATQPSNANVIIQAGYSSGTLSNLVSQYVSIDPNDNQCVPLQEPAGAVNGTYHQCLTTNAGNPALAGTINVDFDSLEAYFFQQGFTNAQKANARRHVLFHGMLAQLGLGGTNTTIDSATRTVFLKTIPITQTTSSEELCRWRQLSDTITNNGLPGTSFEFAVSPNTCP